MGYIQVKPIIDKSVRGLCIKPYPNHPRGCPNFKHKEGCPPGAPLIDDTLNLTRPVYAIYNKFDFASHVERMRAEHPHWSERQLACCLYWQGRARKQLREKIVDFLRDHNGLIIVSCPEAQGVNLTATMQQVGIELEWPPKTVTYQIVLAGQSPGE